MKTCTEDGCTNPYRARGLCSTHYNQRHQPNRHAPQSRRCAVCREPVARPTHNDRRPTCSVECRSVLQGARGLGTYDWATDAVRRARAIGAPVGEVFDRKEIFERDGWVCYLCHEPTDRTADCFDPMSATVDHVVPLSDGGEHSRANARCAHLRCNSIKADHPLRSLSVA